MELNCNNNTKHMNYLILSLQLIIFLRQYRNKRMQMRLFMQVEKISDRLKKQSDRIKILEVIETSDTSRGKILYEQIMNNKPIITWTTKDEKIFISYIELIYPELTERILKIQRRNKLTNHRMLYLKGLKKTDQEVCAIMMLSPEGLRSMRNRTKSV